MKPLFLVLAVVLLSSCSASTENNSPIIASSNSSVSSNSSTVYSVNIINELCDTIYSEIALEGLRITHLPSPYFSEESYDEGTTTFYADQIAQFPVYYVYCNARNEVIHEETMSVANGFQRLVKLYSTSWLSDEDWEKCALGLEMLSSLLEQKNNICYGFWITNKYGQSLTTIDYFEQDKINRLSLFYLNAPPFERENLHTFIAKNKEFQKELQSQFGTLENVKILAILDFLSYGESFYIVTDGIKEYLFSIDAINIPENNIMEFNYSSMNFAGGTLIPTTDFAKHILQLALDNPRE